MAKCDNCDIDAVFAIADRGALPQSFCEKHLPWFYRPRVKAGHLKRLDAPVPAPAVEPEEAEQAQEPASGSKRTRTRSKTATAPQEPVSE